MHDLYDKYHEVSTYSFTLVLTQNCPTLTLFPKTAEIKPNSKCVDLVLKDY